MFFRLIEKKRDRWYQSLSENHAAKVLMRHLDTVEAWHDVQIAALKTYLFLKFECKARPLWKLCSSGAFNTADPNSSSLKPEIRAYLKSHPGASALWEYAGFATLDGREAAPALKKALEESPRQIDAKAEWRKLFHGVRYTDYLFSLPSGAGKTDLMAAVLYIDLYFAWQNPKEKRFARNFLVLVPSTRKTALVSIRRKLETFDPSKVIPEPAASQLKRLLCVDVLNVTKPAKNNLSVKNPNAQKVRFAASTTNGLGCVLVANDEILCDCLNDGGRRSRAPVEDERVRDADELRTLIGVLPNLAIFNLEAHHGDDREVLLRQVVKRWASGRGSTFVHSISFTTTPYLIELETILIADRLEVRSNDVSNAVFHCPLAERLQAPGENVGSL